MSGTPHVHSRARKEARIETPNEITRFECSAEYHLRSWLELAVYHLMYRVGKASGKFFASNENVANYLAASESGVKKAVKKLVNAGFLELLQSGKDTYEANVYRVVTHREWKESHPNKCAEKDDLPWSAGDPLGKALYTASGGRVPQRVFQVDNYRATNLSEERIVTEYTKFLVQHEGKKSKKWRKGIGFHFWQYLRGVAMLESRAA